VTSTHPVIIEEARAIYECMPHAHKTSMGAALYQRLTSVGDPIFDHWLVTAQIAACARQCDSAKREAMPAVTHDGRPLSSGSVLTTRYRTPDGQIVRQLSFWRECSPAEFIEAAKAEQNIIDGRAKANRERLEIVGLLNLRPELMAEATVVDAIEAAGLDPNDYFLDDEATA